MKDILADTHLLGRSFFEQLYCRNNSVTTSVSSHARYVEPGYHECYVVGVPYKETSSVWDRAHVVGIDIPPDSKFSYEEVYLFGLFQMGKQREFWVFDGSGVYRSGLFDDELNFQDLLDQYGKMTELELRNNPFIKQEFGEPQYIYIKSDQFQMAPYESDPNRGYKLVLDKRALSRPDDIVSVRATWYRATDKFNNKFVIRFSGREQNQNEKKFLRRTKERNAWGIMHPIDYRFIEARRLSCIVMSPFGLPITHYRTVLEVLECMRDTIRTHLSLYIDAKILHQDICLHHLFICKPKVNSPDAPKRIPISIGGHRGLPDESRLKPWQSGFEEWSEIAEKKTKNISSNDNFATIVAEFRHEF
ncbi:hypothetical protein J7337_012267 [Fusarium musae]|uniref:Fungal-type protein kinase domain-containing protein n=1 Tax=Fusarium musae TaxID=1042133 RepID=A0A9P8IJ44_9HYPO|nr:hypothetical protein J7337_012267 [Fusarium musae]KAG9495710.1 hypothetical protein J7337_012267 [Fusarium musae]